MIEWATAATRTYPVAVVYSHACRTIRPAGEACELLFQRQEGVGRLHWLTESAAQDHRADTPGGNIQVRTVVAAAAAAAAVRTGLLADT